MARSIQFTPTCFEEYIAWRKLDDDIVGTMMYDNFLNH